MADSHTGAERMARMVEEMAGRNLWAELFELRDRQREDAQKAVWLIKGDDLAWENNAQGKMRWYLHPNLRSPCIHTMNIFVQEIPPGGRSGRLQYSGNMVIYVWEGEGYTVMDGEKHHWAAGDCVQLPARPKGVVFQHFNTSPDKRVRMIAAEPNMVHNTGLDRAGGFEQLEVAPDFRKA